MKLARYFWIHATETRVKVVTSNLPFPKTQTFIKSISIYPASPLLIWGFCETQQTHMCTHKHSRFDTNPCGELLSSPAITSCHWTSLMYLSGCVSEWADWLNAGMQQFTTSKACQSALGAPETSLCQWGIISEGWHWIMAWGEKYQPHRHFAKRGKWKEVEKDGRLRWWGTDR